MSGRGKLKVWPVKKEVFEWVGIDANNEDLCERFWKFLVSKAKRTIPWPVQFE